MKLYCNLELYNQNFVCKTGSALNTHTHNRNQWTYRFDFCFFHTLVSASIKQSYNGCKFNDDDDDVQRFCKWVPFSTYVILQWFDFRGQSTWDIHLHRRAMLNWNDLIPSKISCCSQLKVLMKK